jgi:hypothetical protein
MNPNPNNNINNNFAAFSQPAKPNTVTAPKKFLTKNNKDSIKKYIKGIKAYIPPDTVKPTNMTNGNFYNDYIYYNKKQELITSITNINKEIKKKLRTVKTVDDFTGLKQLFETFKQFKEEVKTLKDNYKVDGPHLITEVKKFLNKKKNENSIDVSSYDTEINKIEPIFNAHLTEIDNFSKQIDTVYDKYKNNIKDIYTELFTVFNNELGNYQEHKDKFIKLTQEVLNFKHTDNITGQIDTIKGHKNLIKQLSTNTSGIFNIIKNINVNHTINIGNKPQKFNNDLNKELSLFYEKYQILIQQTLEQLKFEHKQYNELCEQLQITVAKIRKFKSASPGTKFNEGIKHLLNEYDTLIKTNKQCQEISTAVGAAMGPELVNDIPPHYDSDNESVNINTNRIIEKRLNNIKFEDKAKAEFIYEMIFSSKDRRGKTIDEKSRIKTILGKDMNNKMTNFRNNRNRINVVIKRRAESMDVMPQGSYSNNIKNINMEDNKIKVLTWCYANIQFLIEYLNKP